MSLINNMLNDLEKNRGASKNKEVLSGMVLTTRKPQGSLGWKLIYVAIVLTIAFGIFRYYNPTFITDFKKRLPGTKPLENNVAVALKSPTVKLQDVVLEQKNNQTILDFILSVPTPYYIEHASEQQVSITLSNTGISGNLPVSLEGSFIVSLSTKQNKNNIVSTLTLLPGTKIDKLQLIDKPKPYLHLVLSNPQLTKRSISKIPIPLSPEEQAIEHYQEIQQLLAQNKTQNAIQKLHLFIGDFPNHNQARATLVSLLIKEGRIQKADDVLMVGLNKYGDYYPFIKLKAHILIKQNKTLDAIDLLQKYLVGTSDVEYLALLATLYQQQEAFMPAAELYNQLTKIQPQKAAWWLGLGVALEGAGKANGAKEAYQRAYNSSDTSPELSAFLNDKVKK